MSRKMIIQDRDRTILKALTCKVRLLTQRQLADFFWKGSLPNARRRMKWLRANGLVERVVLIARLITALSGPLATWEPGQPPPNFGAIAHQAQVRWRRTPARSCVTWVATEKAAHLFGGVRRGELKNPLQASHDIGVAAVWLRMKQVDPRWARSWQSEDMLAHTRRGQKIPDAFIVDDERRVVWVVEFIGEYDRQRVQAFHEDCESRGIPYQMW